MEEALFLVSTDYIFASVEVLLEVKDTYNDLNENGMFYDYHQNQNINGH